LNNKLAALQGIVETGEYKPTDQTYAVFKELSARLDQQLARVEELVKSELPAFNKVLSEHNLGAVTDDAGRRQ
jgi:hypothetical protein